MNMHNLCQVSFVFYHILSLFLVFENIFFFVAKR